MWEHRAFPARALAAVPQIAPVLTGAEHESLSLGCRQMGGARQEGDADLDSERSTLGPVRRLRVAKDRRVAAMANLGR